jgi:hypothetical protein
VSARPLSAKRSARLPMIGGRLPVADTFFPLRRNPASAPFFRIFRKLTARDGGSQVGRAVALDAALAAPSRLPPRWRVVGSDVMLSIHAVCGGAVRPCGALACDGIVGALAEIGRLRAPQNGGPDAGARAGLGACGAAARRHGAAERVVVQCRWSLASRLVALSYGWQRAVGKRLFNISALRLRGR